MKKGFTLVELMITLAIFSILLTLAVTSYQTSIRKSHRADALTSLTKYQAMLERCYAQNFSYKVTCDSLPGFPINTTDNYYTIALSNLSDTTYTLTATPLNDQQNDTTCASFSINEANEKKAFNSQNTAQSSCWGQ